MMKQKGSAATAILIVFALLFGTMLLVAGAVTVWAIGVQNRFVSLENQISAEYDKGKAILSQGGQAVADMSKLTGVAAKQIKDVTVSAIQGRYGDGGSKAVFQVLQEQNGAVDPQLYRNVQAKIAGTREEFQNNQNLVTDRKRAAYTMLDTIPTKYVLGFFGQPDKNIGYRGQKDDYPVILSVQSKSTFETGIDKGFDIQ